MYKFIAEKELSSVANHLEANELRTFILVLVVLVFGLTNIWSQTKDKITVYSSVNADKTIVLQTGDLLNIYVIGFS